MMRDFYRRIVGYVNRPQRYDPWQTFDILMRRYGRETMDVQMFPRRIYGFILKAASGEISPWREAILDGR